MNQDHPEITYAQAVREALIYCMEKDPRVYVIGEGVPDPKGIFGTTLGLRNQFGDERVLDMPLAENGMTGICMGTALTGMRPVMVHQRADFAFLAIDQLINNVAKWHYMFNGQAQVPIVIRLIIGRGWGQGPQHAFSPHALFAHVPGFKVVLPASAYDAKGMMISAIEDNNPVIFIEHRWLHHIVDKTPKEPYRVPLNKARKVRDGNDITLAAFSYMVVEAALISDVLKSHGISLEVIDMRSASPLDSSPVIESAIKTGRLIILDTGHVTGGIGAELQALVMEKAFGKLKVPPIRIGLPDIPTPTSPQLTEAYYPTADIIAKKILQMLNIYDKSDWEEVLSQLRGKGPKDVPYLNFTGPF